MYMDLSKINGWAVQNLRQYGNSLLPPELIKDFGSEKIEGVLATIIDEPVLIEKKHYPREQLSSGHQTGKRGYYYIARTPRDPILSKKEMRKKKIREVETLSNHYPMETP